MSEYEHKLKEKLKTYKVRRDELKTELEKKFDTEMLRELNIVLYKIEVAKNRLGNSYNRSTEANTTFYSEKL